MVKPRMMINIQLSNTVAVIFAASCVCFVCSFKLSPP